MFGFDIAKIPHLLITYRNMGGQIVARYRGVAGKPLEKEWIKPDVSCWVETNHKSYADLSWLEKGVAKVEHSPRPAGVKGMV